MTRNMWIVLLIAVMGAALAAPVQAVFVSNTGSGKTLFVDTYESPDSIAGSTQPPANNGAFPGDWGGPNASSIIVREQGYNSETPNPAFGGTQVGFPTFLNGDNGGFAVFDQTQTSGTIHIETRTFIFTGQSGALNYVFELENGGHGGRAFSINLNNGTWGEDFTGSSFSVGTYNYDEWNKVEIDYTLGSDSVMLTLNGVSDTVSNLIARGASQSMATHLDIRGNGNGAYLDFIPEPGTLSLLAVGGLMLLRRRR